MTILFISDLHLSAERTDITDCFLTFMKDEAKGIDALYVLGDLFEMWIGDDDDVGARDTPRLVVLGNALHVAREADLLYDRVLAIEGVETVNCLVEHRSLGAPL